MNRIEREAIYEKLLTALETALDSCTFADREERLPQIEACCREAAALATELLRTRRAAST